MEKKPLLYVMISATLFGISPPIAKLLIEDISPIALAGLLYLGAFAGLFAFTVFRKIASPRGIEKAAPLERVDIPWLAGAILTGGVIAPVALMMGLALTSGFATSLLLNLEGVATAIIAVLMFKEYAGRRLWLALILMTIAGVFLAWSPGQNGVNLVGPLLIILAMICWGIDNNLTNYISNKDPTQIAQLKGLIAGTISLGLALLLGMNIPFDMSIIFALILGLLSYGFSLVFFIKALEGLGSSRTGAFFSFGPFIGALVSILILGDAITWPLAVATVLMVVGVWMLLTERHGHLHRHDRITHTHELRPDVHHQGIYPGSMGGRSPQEHTHEPLTHSHVHWPDRHHRHEHR